jgi:hypothetical protein
MEKIRIFLYSFIILLVGIIVFSLTKSWLVYDRGIEVIPVEKEKTNDEADAQIPEKKETWDDWPDNARIHWKNSLIYPLGLNNESGGLGPDGIMHHARNLITVSLQTGKKRKLFDKNVYIWDFFPGDFNKRTGFTSSDEPRLDSLSLESKIVIFAATIDTNLDGFLNHKDRKKVFLFDTAKDRLIEVLPEDLFFDKLIWNAGANRLALVVTRGILIGEEPKQRFEFSAPTFFIFDAVTNKRTIVEIVE